MQNKVFDDILVDFEQILEGGFKSMGYSVDQLINNVVLPSFEDAENIAEDLKQYYMQLIRVSQRRYDEVKLILETFYRQLIIEKRQEMEIKHEEDKLTEADFNLEEQSTFALIAEHHGDKLGQLRDNFDSFNTMIDTRFDEIMHKLRLWSGYNT